MNPTAMVDEVKPYLLNLQERICAAFEQEETSKKFEKESWQHAQGGGGRTCVLAEGRWIEQGAVNFSHVHGDQLPVVVTQQCSDLEGYRFQAMGVSVIIHPINPYVPTTHFNLRFFLAQKENAQPVWWFGGGFDLTPYYGFEEDCCHWHRTAQAACQVLNDPLAYARYKKQCDDYFYLKHRHEPRGIGGIFFDHLNQWEFERTFAFVRSVGDHFLWAYLPIVQRRRHLRYGKRERDFQCYRRGRYVEFNLIYDRGTLFGLQTGGRTEAILVSLPPQVIWRYNWQPEPHSPEATLYEKYLVAKDWVT